MNRKAVSANEEKANIEDLQRVPLPSPPQLCQSLSNQNNE